MFKKQLVLLLNLVFLLTGINSAFAEIKIHCPKCYRHLFNYAHNDIKMFHVEHLEVVVDSNQNANSLTCSFDNAPLNGYKYWFWSRGLEEPRMAYSGMTVWTVVDGKFRWYPYEVEME